MINPDDLDLGAIADDFDVFDGVELVTVQVRNLQGVVESEVEGVKALRRAIATSPAGVGAGAQMVSDRARWHVKASDLELPPKKGDRVVSDDSGTWEVATVSAETFRTRYACECRRVST